MYLTGPFPFHIQFYRPEQRLLLIATTRPWIKTKEKRGKKRLSYPTVARTGNVLFVYPYRLNRYPASGVWFHLFSSGWAIPWEACNLIFSPFGLVLHSQPLGRVLSAAQEGLDFRLRWHFLRFYEQSCVPWGRQVNRRRADE